MTTFTVHPQKPTPATELITAGSLQEILDRYHNYTLPEGPLVVLDEDGTEVMWIGGYIGPNQQWPEGLFGADDGVAGADRVGLAP